MRIVLDTNVLVSALLNPFGAPGRVLDLILAGAVQIVYDDRILAEYREVLARPRFGFEKRHVQRLMEYLIFTGEGVSASPLNVDAPDVDDLPFAEVAVSGNVDALVTGNPEHFAFITHPPVLSPAEFLQLWLKRSTS
ncbi:putative toxin-antitoxin system toxin component, PIN family [Thermanaerothrix sp. 4228-RoL]|uniref:Toxin-antitoxin system toxin component, PIN family n=1 Tax=Thermanaerothrix solaris TaxID=3058434 RepID=A0ABU3NRK3_9CHLR|nr:putative toxin-antitoxin system toxin component, PIN family [Thermanaerothrix sp. 4228-RoL]MDT8899474.1 putative toxin-antitoxin system toxin component, PIN family [Thermanaerothrix sp. 4228-RoL]